jgi:hypothetical protein
MHSIIFLQLSREAVKFTIVTSEADLTGVAKNRLKAFDFKTFYSPQRRRERKERPRSGGLRPKKE